MDLNTNTTTRVESTNQTSTAPYAPEPSNRAISTLEIGIGVASIFVLMIFFGTLIYLWRFRKQAKAWFEKVKRTKNINVPDKTFEEPIYISSRGHRVSEPIRPQPAYIDRSARPEYDMENAPLGSPSTGVQHPARLPPHSYAAHRRASAVQSQRWI